MEWDDDDNESNENAESLNNATDKLETFKVNLRKSFIPHKKRVVLQELEPISENNILEDCSDYLSKSINFNLRQRKKSMNPQCAYRSADSAESEATQPETPPAALRQRIIEAQEMREYLEKELNELKDFTTSEKQVLAAEKGIEDLRSSLDEIKNKLEISNLEKDLICKELEEMKRKYVDEQTEKQILETKWKHREDDLKKSLEEAWSLLRIKEDRITKMNEKISFLYSEREKVKDLNFTFGGQLLPAADEHRFQTIEQNISELFELSCHNSFDNGRTLNHNNTIDCKGDNVQNNGFSEVNILHEELAKYKHSVEMHKKQVADLNRNLADKDLLISTYELNLSDLENYVSNYLSNDLICADKDNHTHKTPFEKIKCDIKFVLSKYNVNLKPKECGVNFDVENEKKIVLDQSMHQDFKERLEDGKLKEISTELLSDISIQTYEHGINFVEERLDASGLNFSKGDQRINEREKREDIIDVTMQECQKEILMNYKTKNVMHYKIIKYEEEIKNNDVELNILKAKLAEYEKGISKPTVIENSSQTIDLDFIHRNERITNCIKDISSDLSHNLNDSKWKVEADNDNKQMIGNDKLFKLESKISLQERITNEEVMNILENKILDCEEKMINTEEQEKQIHKEEKIYTLQTTVSDYEEKIKKYEEEINMLQSNVVGYEEIIHSYKEEINILCNKISGYEEKFQCNEDEINKLQSSVTTYENKIKNKDEEISLLHSKVTDCDETIKNNEKETYKLQTNISNFEEKSKNEGEEINMLRSKVVGHEETINSDKEEINILLSKISGYKQKIQCNEDEINQLHNSITAYEEKMKNKDEEIRLLQSKVTDCEETIKNNEEEICNLQANISDYEEKSKNKDEEINVLQCNAIGHEEIINSYKEEISILLNKISGYEDNIQCNEDEINQLQSSITAHEEKMKNKDEEISLWQSKVTDCEKTIKNNEEEICKLQVNISDYEEKSKNKEEEVNILQNNVVGHEEIINRYKEEINILHSKISGYEDKIQCNEDEINQLQNSITAYEEKMKNKDEEIHLLQSKVTDCEEIIKNNEEEICKLQANISNYEEKSKNKNEEINVLQCKAVGHEEIIKSYKEELNILHSKISEYEDNIQCNEDEINQLQSSITAHEEKMKNKDEEISLWQSKVTDWEKTIKNNEEEICKLQTNISDYEEKMKNKDEEIYLLQSKVTDCEEIIKNNEEEICKLQANISDYEEKSKNKNEEINVLQCKAVGHEEIIKSYKEEINILHSKISGYEDNIQCNEDKINQLQSSITAHEEKMKNKDEEISLWQSKVTDCEKTIKNNEEEICKLQANISDYEEKSKNKEEEVNILQNNVVGHEEIINRYKEEINILHSKISGYEDKIQCNEDEINQLQNSITAYEEKMKNKDEEIHLLQSKVTDCEETIKNNEEEICKLQANISDYEEKSKNKNEEINVLQFKAVGHEEIINSHKKEINILHSKISRYEDNIQCNEDEINKLQSSITAYEEKMKSKDEEIRLLQSKVTDCEETIKNNEEEICKLQANISDYEEKSQNKDEEINVLQYKAVGHEEIINSYKEEINILHSKISGYEEKIQCNEDEVNKLQSSITAYEEKMKNKDEEIHLLQSKVTDREETIKNNEYEINVLKNTVSGYDGVIKKFEEKIHMLEDNVVTLHEKVKFNDELSVLEIDVSSYKEQIKNKEEEVSILLSKVLDYEYAITKNEEEINKLKTNVSSYEEKIKQKEEELNMKEKSVVDLEETIRSKLKEINILLNKVSVYEEKIANYEEEINTLKNDVSCYEESIKQKVEEISMLGRSVVCLEEIINSKIEEINILLTKVSVYEEKINNNEEEIIALQNEVSIYKDKIKNREEEISMLGSNATILEETIKSDKEEIITLQNKVLGYEEKLKNNEEEINLLQRKVSGYQENNNLKDEELILLKNKISAYEEEVKNRKDFREETNVLKNKVLCYEKTINDYADEINLLKNKISKNEQAISEKLPLSDKVSESVQNFYDFDNTVCSSISAGMFVSYANNDLVEYDMQPSADNTLNFTTLDSSSQLEQSVFISKLPQTDNSIKEYDPLASVAELSYTNEELETTLTEQFIKPCRFENLDLLHESNLINSTYAKYNVNENIKALICLFNNGGDMSSLNFDDISKQLLAVKEILEPKEDYVIYSFCQIIQQLLNKELANKKILNEKMLVVKETLSNLQNIKDSFLKLKNSFSSLENITSQDHETINSHFKNLFLCNRELSTENVLLKEQLKVSLLSEEKLSRINELLRSDLTNTLEREKDLKIMTEYNKKLEDKLKEKCKKENDIILFIDKIANLLNPNLSWPTDHTIKKLEQIYSLLMESISQVECEDLSDLGVLDFFRNLVTQNSVLKQKIDPTIKIMKGDLTSLNVDITHKFKNLNADFYSISCKLSELYEKQEQESSANNVLRDNVMNLVLENRELKVELDNLRILNNDLSSTSKEYSILMDKYKNLNNIIQEKDDLLRDQVKFQEQVYSFVDSLKDLYFMNDFQKFNNSFSFTDKSNYIDFLAWLTTFLKEVHSIYESLLQNIKSPHYFNLSEVVSELVKEKNDMTDAYSSLNSSFHIIKQSLMLCPENISNIKDTLNAISSDVLKSKYSFIQDILSINKNMETLLLSYHQRDIEYESYKCNSQKSYNELNEKHLELLCSYENMEIELKSSKALIQELIKEKDELKRGTADFDYKSNELRQLISSYEMELLDYKNLCSSLENKIIDVEKEKEKIEENFKQYVTLGEYNNLRADKNKLTEIIQNLKNLNCTLKDSCGDLISCDIKNLGDDFIHLKNIIYSLLEVRNKYTNLELNYAELLSERNELLSKIESLNSLIKESVEKQKDMKDEIQVLIEKNSEQTGSLYSKKVIELLILLGYENPTKIDDLAWTFIEKNISKYMLMVNQNTENDKFELEEKMLYLESQLSDAQDFKSKFSKELHMLKPDLDISYLMSLSLADLQKTMIIAIIEKEKDVIEDYEMKLALSTDRIQQLEEQQKRREDWLQEIEKENERLTNECKQIQNDNESLKADLNLKLRKIIDLEHQITQQINGEQIKEYIKEREDSNNQLETAANEKNTLRLSIASLNEKLQNKSIECEEVYNSLQKKAEVIFGLEKVLSKSKTENANLEKEVQHLRESMLLNLNNFNDNKQALERDLTDYKVQIEKLYQLVSDTQKEVKTENKSVSTDLDKDVEMELKIKGSLSNHLAKIESLNLKIDDLNSQLKQQNNKFDKEFENQAKFIESLEKELNMANDLNAALRNNLISNHNQEEDKLQHLNSIEGLQSEIMSLREHNSLLENERALLLKDKEELEQARIMHEEKESLADNLEKEIESIKCKLREEEDKSKTKQEEIDNLLLKLDSFGKELTSAQNTIEDLLKQDLENKKLKEEVTSLISELEHCKMEISALIKENEIKKNQLSECFSNLSLEKEISCSVKSLLEQTRQELLNLKTANAHLIEKQHKDLQLEKDLYSKLNSDLCQMKEINALQETELVYLKNELKEKVIDLEEMSSNSHLEKSCPFMKEAEDIKTKHNDLNKQLEHERETFKLWKTNLEEDLHCKLLKINDLELKLKKETQCYKEALMNNSELHQKLQESLEKFKRLEDKIAIQRDVFIKEKSKSEIDLQNKEKLLIELEEKLLSVKYKCEEFSKDICMFLDKLSVMLQVDVIDLSSAITLINNLTIEKQMLVKEFKKTQEKAEQLEKELKESQKKAEFFEKELKKAQEMIPKLEEELKETREKAEQLEEECEELNNDIKYHENEIGNLYKNGKLKEEKWMKEKEELEKELLQMHELKEKICSQDKVILSLHMKIENYDKSFITFNAEKKILESEKLELERKIIDLEKSLQSLKNQEISYLDGIKREMNHLKLELFNKNKAISKLEMRLESDTLPFQKKAELAERKVEELTKELRILKQSQSFKQMSSVLTSPMTGLEMSPPFHKNKDKIIERLEQEVKQLITEKSALKLLAQNRRVQINELKDQLGKKDVHSFQD